MSSLLTLLVLMCSMSVNESSVPAASCESSQMHVSTADDAVGFTVLGEVEPRSARKVRLVVIGNLMFLNDTLHHECRCNVRYCSE